MGTSAPSGAVPHNSIPAETGGLAAGTALLAGQSTVGATLVTPVRHPNDGQAAGSVSCFPWDTLGVLPVPASSQGTAHLFPQLVLVNDALQLLCQLRVLLAELHVPLTLLLDLSLDFTQCALEVIGYFFPLLIFLPCPLDCFLLLLNWRGHSK